MFESYLNVFNYHYLRDYLFFDYLTFLKDDFKFYSTSLLCKNYLTFNYLNWKLGLIFWVLLFSNLVTLAEMHLLPFFTLLSLSSLICIGLFFLSYHFRIVRLCCFLSCFYFFLFVFQKYRFLWDLGYPYFAFLSKGFTGSISYSKYPSFLHFIFKWDFGFLCYGLRGFLLYRYF